MLETLHVVVALLQWSIFPFLLTKPLVFCCLTSHSFASIMQNHDPSLETNSFSSMFVASIPIFRCFKSPYLLQNPGSLIFHRKIPIFVASNPHFQYVKSPLNIRFSPDYPLIGWNKHLLGFPRLPVTFPLLLAYGDADADVPPLLVRSYAEQAKASAPEMVTTVAR